MNTIRHTIFIAFLCQILPPMVFAASTIDGIFKQAQAGDANYQYTLGKKYRFGNGVKKDLKQGYKWTLKAAEQHHRQAQTAMGWLYFSGNGVEQDFDQAALWYGKAAQAGFPNAQRALGVLYEEGKGVEKNPSLAAEWYLKAAKQKNPRAMVNLGTLYRTGVGVKLNNKAAFDWYSKSTFYNYSRGETHLAEMYELGLGVKKNIETAKTWYAKAANKGYAKAKIRLLKLQLKSTKSLRPKKSIDLTENVTNKTKPAVVLSSNLQKKSLQSTTSSKQETQKAQKYLKSKLIKGTETPVPSPETNINQLKKLTHRTALKKALEILKLFNEMKRDTKEQTSANKMTLADVVHKVKKKNNRIMAEQSKWKKKLLDVESALSIFEPELVSSIHHEDRSQRNTIEEKVSRQFQSEFAEQNTDYNVSVEGLASTGARLNFGSSFKRMANSFTKSLTDENSEYQLYVGGSITQPLLKGRGVEITRTNILVAQKNSDIAFQEYRQEMMRIIADAVSSFWDLYLAQKIVSLRESSVRMANKILHDNKERVKAGKMAEIELMEAEVEVTLRKALTMKANQSLTSSMNKLRTILSTKAQNDSEKFEADEKPSFLEVKLNPESIMNNTFSLRPDYLLTLKKVEGADIQLRYAKNQKWPQLDLKASYGLNGLDFKSSRAISTVTDADYDEWTIGLEFRIPLQGGTKSKSEYKKAQEEKKHALLGLKDIEIELANNVDTSIHRINSSAEQVNYSNNIAKIKKRILDIEVKRLEAGKSDSRALFDREEEYILARETQLGSIVDYQRAVLDLKMADGSLLQEYGIDIMEEN